MLNIEFKSGKRQLCENVKLTEDMIEQLNEKIKRGIIVDYRIL